MDVEESSEQWRRQQRQKRLDGEDKKPAAVDTKAAKATPAYQKNAQLLRQGGTSNSSLPTGTLRFLKPSACKAGSVKEINSDDTVICKNSGNKSKSQRSSKGGVNEEEGIAEAVSLSNAAQPGAYSGVPGEPLQRVAGLPHISLGRGTGGVEHVNISNHAVVAVEGNEYEYSTSQTTGLVEAHPVDSTILSLPEASEVDPGQLRQEERKPDPIYCRKLPLSALLVLLLLGTGLVVMFILRGRDNVIVETQAPTVSPIPTIAPVPTVTPSASPSVSSSPTISPVSPYCASTGTSECDISPLLPEQTRRSILDPSSPQLAAHSFVTTDPSLWNYSASRIRQRFALATFYYSTNGASWVYDRGWLTNADECRWYSRKAENETWDYSPCNSQGIYEDLLQWKNDLSGRIPPEISLLTALKRVNLQNQLLEWTLPSEMGLCTNLKELNLTRNFGLRGTVPSEIGQLSKLESLDISMSSFTGGIPSEIGSLSALSKLHTFGNGLSGFPDSICELPALMAPLVDCVSSTCPIECDCECFVEPPADFLGDTTACCADGVTHCCSEASSSGGIVLDGDDIDLEEASAVVTFVPSLLLALSVPLLMTMFFAA